MSPAGHGDDRLVRSYVVTGGRAQPSRNTLDHITLISLSADSADLNRAPLNPEQLAVLAALSQSSQSVVELAALLRLPVSVMRILLCDLMEAGHITAQRRITDAAAPDITLLEAVLAGLQRL
ncbi:DUF742 domain-containing protein [Streptomyces sp. NPDC001743]|uniref:DUF742 domain-containing protein n=1 Tax=Streptomyces sp. NPDC001743 TaxID=3154397 RepID=UPI003323CE6D